ncbi:MAG TPA: hypothetical protein PLX90_02470 [Anaerolineales bacterium]|nr:hypothetical protein [Anaerolineales bacterium]
MKNKRNWIIGIVLSATAAFVALQTVNAPSSEAITPEVEVIASETFTNETCAFMWAYQDAPELTKNLDDAVKELNPDASAKATLFGEDCIYSDGSKTFGVIETDFTVRLPVGDLTQHEEFGNWIKQVMDIVTEIPREEIQGKYGFVEFWFEKNINENITFRVPIDKYVDEAKDKSGVELFEYFYKQ